MIVLAQLVKNLKHIPVDEWGTDKYPIDEQDIIFKNVKDEIILPISKFFKMEGEKKSKQLDYFIMKRKRSYNSDVTRNHICNYLNYFEKFYDTDKELLMVIYEIKTCIDTNKDYTRDEFMADVNRYIIRNKKLDRYIKRFVRDNYQMKLSSNNHKTPNLQYENKHAKILYEISLMTNMYIPLATHYMFMHMISVNVDIKDFLLELFGLCVTKYEEEEGVYMYNKIYETAVSVVNKSKNPHKPLWDMNAIRGINTTTHTKDSVEEVILQIMPKYTYDKNIINFNYFSNRRSLQTKVTDIKYEYNFVKLSSSKRDADNNSEYDRFEARLNKKDEALSLQNKVAAEQAVKKIEALYGPFSQQEIDHYRNRLISGGASILNPLQKKLVGYLFYKEFGDPCSFKAINHIDYIKMIIAGKRMLRKSDMAIMPYLISCKVVKIASRKNLSKREQEALELDELFNRNNCMYNNANIKQKIIELYGQVISSSYEIIDYDQDRCMPTEIDGIPVPIVNDIIREELMRFISMIPNGIVLI